MCIDVVVNIITCSAAPKCENINVETYSYIDFLPLQWDYFNWIL